MRKHSYFFLLNTFQSKNTDLSTTTGRYVLIEISMAHLLDIKYLQVAYRRALDSFDSQFRGAQLFRFCFPCLFLYWPAKFRLDICNVPGWKIDARTYNLHLSSHTKRNTLILERRVCQFLPIRIIWFKSIFFSSTNYFFTVLVNVLMPFSIGRFLLQIGRNPPILLVHRFLAKICQWKTA